MTTSYPPNWIMFRWKARIFATSSGSISILSSALVISIILRCKRGVWSSPYHRIILFFCFWDIVSSSAIILTVLPMPADVQEIYPFPGKAYGNKATCEAQAFFIVMGQAFTVCTNCVLNIYYVCTIRYGTSEEKLNRSVLPIALVVSCVLVFPTAFFPLFFGLFNPRPHEPYCLIGSYPENCNRDENIVCISKNVEPQTEDLIVFTNSVLIGIGFLSIILSLSLVVVAVFKSEMIASQIRRDTEMKCRAEMERLECRNEQQDNDQREQLPVTPLKEFRETLTCGRVALLYIAAFFITWIWTVLSLLGGKIFSFSQDAWDIIGYAKLLCLPLQGFFNALIFIYHKAQNIRKRSSENITFFEALKRLIISPKRIPPERYVSSIDMIDKYILHQEEMEALQEEMEAHHEEIEAHHEEIHCIKFESVKHFNLVADVSSTGIPESKVDKLERDKENLAPDINFHKQKLPLSQQPFDLISCDTGSKSRCTRDSLLSGFSDVFNLVTDVSSTGTTESKVDKLERDEEDLAPDINYHKEKSSTPRSSDCDTSSKSRCTRDNLLSGFSDAFNLVADVSSTGTPESKVEKLERDEKYLGPDINYHKEKSSTPRSSDLTSYDTSSKSQCTSDSLLSGFSDAFNLVADVSSNYHKEKSLTPRSSDLTRAE